MPPRKVDLSKVQKKKEEEEAIAAASSFQRSVQYYTKVGKNRIRLLPPWTGKGVNSDQFWREIAIHFSVPNFEDPDPNNLLTVACPKNTPDAPAILGVDNPSCPICDAIEQLKLSGDAQDLERAKDTRAKTYFISNVLNIDDPIWTEDAIEELKQNGFNEDSLPIVGNPKIQVFRYGRTILNQILACYTDDYDLTDIKNGKTIVIQRSGKGIKTEYVVTLYPPNGPAKFPISAKYVTTIEDSDSLLWDLDKEWRFLTVTQLEAFLHGATVSEVWKMGSTVTALPAAKQQKQLAATGMNEDTGAASFLAADTEEAEESEEEETEEEETEESVEEEEETSDSDQDCFDEDGDIDYDKLTDEQIEDSNNASLADDEGRTAYVSCFGRARERNQDDESCQECFLFDRCGNRIAFLDAEEKKKLAAKKKKVPGKAAAGKKVAGKAGKEKTAGKAAKTKKNNAKKISSSPLDDLEAEMKGII